MPRLSKVNPASQLGASQLGTGQLGGDGASDERLIIGTIGKPHGIHGAFRLHSAASPPEDIFRYPTVFRLNPSKNTDGGARPLQADKLIRVHQVQLVARLDSIRSRTAISALTNSPLLVDIAELHKTASAIAGDDEEHLVHDLIGMGVVWLAHPTQLVGEITAIDNHGNADILVVTVTPTDAIAYEVLVPFSDDCVDSVCHATRRIHLKPAAQQWFELAQS